MTDEQIIQLYFERNEQALEETKNSYGKRLFALAKRILRNNEDSEECVLDTYLQAWNSIPPTKPKYFFAYLAKICRHNAFGKLDYAKAQKRSGITIELSHELLECIPGKLTEITLEEKELGRLINIFLAGLPQETRILFVKRYWFGDSIKEISRAYQIGESKVKTSLHRTRKKLRDYLEKEGYTP